MSSAIPVSGKELIVAAHQRAQESSIAEKAARDKLLGPEHQRAQESSIAENAARIKELCQKIGTAEQMLQVTAQETDQLIERVTQLKQAGEESSAKLKQFEKKTTAELNPANLVKGIVVSTLTCAATNYALREMDHRLASTVVSVSLSVSLLGWVVADCLWLQVTSGGINERSRTRI